MIQRCGWVWMTGTRKALRSGQTDPTLSGQTTARNPCGMNTIKTVCHGFISQYHSFIITRADE